MGIISFKLQIKNPSKSLEETEIFRLEKNSYFGEAALLSSRQPATVTVISESAKCLRMNKSVSDELVKVALENQSSMSKIIGEIVINQIPLFNVLAYSNKQSLLRAMSYSNYLPHKYICHQGMVANRFFIVIMGTCKVTVNTSDDVETEVSILRPGDYFGKRV